MRKRGTPDRSGSLNFLSQRAVQALPPLIQAPVDAIALAIQPAIDPVSPAVQTVVDAVALSIQAVFDPLAFSLGLRLRKGYRKCEKEHSTNGYDLLHLPYLLIRKWRADALVLYKRIRAKGVDSPLVSCAGIWA